MDTVPRRVIDAGTWDVVHPFTGRVEFTTTDRELAEAVRDEFDRIDPVTFQHLLDLVDAVPFNSRSHWVVHPRLALALRKGLSLSVWFAPSFTATGEDLLIGFPVTYDSSARGISLQSKGDRK